MQIQIHLKKQRNVFHAVNKTRVAAMRASYALPSLVASYSVPVLKNA
jgi:hypothetical protein